MKRVTKAVFGALAVAGSAMALSAPATAQSVYFGADSNGGVYGGYNSGGYADPYYADPGYADPGYGSYDPYASYDYAYDDPSACSYYDLSLIHISEPTR